MKKTRLITMVSLILMIMSSSLFSQTLAKNEVDEFTGNSVIQTEAIQIEHEGFDGAAMASVAIVDEYFALLIEIGSDEWQHLTNNTAYFVVDGNRVQFKAAEINTSTLDNGMHYKQIGIMLSDKVFDSFSKASNIKLKLDGNIYILPAETIESFAYVRDTWYKQSSKYTGINP